MKRILLFLAAVTAISSLSTADENADYRLPAGIAPVSQSIELTLDPSRNDYSGSTNIQLSVAEETDRIGLHQIGLSLNNIVLLNGSSERRLSAVEGEWDVTWLSDGKPIAAGEYILNIAFDGNYSTDSLGMHRVRFEDNDYVFTQMEAMYARRAIPLFDEPSFKIPYTLTINAPEGLTVVANTPVESTRNRDGLQSVTFATSKPLPSYLLAFAVGPLDSAPIEGISVPGRVYTPKGRAGELGFVLRETPKIVAALEDYFGSDYPYAKLDFVAVPEFAFGAMENPGLITYRTDLLLVGDDVAGANAEMVLNVIAHEVAHIWYGDLVTMAWWDDLWLNEAFATWMARSTLERIYPQYDPELKLPQGGAFAADQQTTSKAIRRIVRNEEEIFDGIGLNYTKGHAILRMLENYVGHEVWQRAIRQYLKQFAWSNATESDLWAIVSAESGLDVAKIAGDFLNQPGFATLTLDGDGTVSQKRYLTYGRTAPDLAWNIPLDVKYKVDGEVRQTFHLLDGKEDSLDIPDNADWIFPDAGGNGYFRWTSDPTQFYALIEDADALSNREKIALLDNAEALLNSGDLTMADYLFVLKRFLNDPYPLVFLPALEKVKAIGDDFVDADNREAFSRFVNASLSDRFDEFGAATRDGDSEAVIQARPRLMRVLGEYGRNEDVIRAARSLVDRYLESASSVDSNLGREALRVTALADDGTLYDRYRRAYTASKSQDQRTNILSAIYFNNADIARKHLDFTLTEDVAAGDAVTGLNFYTSILDDTSVLYEWLDENIDAFKAKLPSYYAPALPQIVGGTACSSDELNQLKMFFAERDEIYASSLSKAVESAEACIDRRTRHGTALAEFLAGD